jgi:L-asparaginase
MKKQQILIILTGGTIDWYWEGKSDTAVPNKHSVVPAYFAKLSLYVDVTFEEVCMKDSRQLTAKDIKQVQRLVEKSNRKKIIIIHGTYTMPDTARYLMANLKRKDQTIVLTGSMVPLEGFTSSDAPFNLGYAVALLDQLSPGVYIAMNGKIFSAEESAKNIGEGRFYSVFDKQQ